MSAQGSSVMNRIIKGKEATKSTLEIFRLWPITYLREEVSVLVLFLPVGRSVTPPWHYQAIDALDSLVKGHFPVSLAKNENSSSNLHVFLTVLRLESACREHTMEKIHVPFYRRTSESL